MANNSRVIVSGSFDDLRSRQIRFLQEAAKLGDVHVQLWSDQAVKTIEGHEPKFPVAERLYFVEAIRFVKGVTAVDVISRDALLTEGKIAGRDMGGGSSWMTARQKSAPLRKFRIELSRDCRSAVGWFSRDRIGGGGDAARKKVLVTGCYDWLHTGHVRFFEEVSEYGDVHAVVGQDANIEFLKGPGHPQFRQDERRYMVGSLRFVKQALVATGMGWLDAEPEIQVIKPDIYAVNEDGDKPEKRTYCEAHGIEYLVLKLTAQARPSSPAEHHPARGFKDLFFVARASRPCPAIQGTGETPVRHHSFIAIHCPCNIAKYGESSISSGRSTRPRFRLESYVAKINSVD